MCSDRQDICSEEDKVNKTDFESIMCLTNDCQTSDCCDTRDRCVDSDCSDYGGGWSEKWKKTTPMVLRLIVLVLLVKKILMNVVKKDKNVLVGFAP